jgi:hypothetical protein
VTAPLHIVLSLQPQPDLPANHTDVSDLATPSNILYTFTFSSTSALNVAYLTHPKMMTTMTMMMMTIKIVICFLFIYVLAQQLKRQVPEQVGTTQTQNTTRQHNNNNNNNNSYKAQVTAEVK